MNTIDLEVKGMSCDSCVKHVTQALHTQSGVQQVDVNLQSGHVKVSGDLPADAQPLIAALDAAGYPAKLTTSALPSADKPSGGCGSSTGKAKGGCCCG
ncbi:heavy metal-associated domain-containing protein [uncultured Acidovorax sp.]|uniref:heavy-metal-associated domain-containing protein n=1 Tax=uncultured Acidovorax sp. TaxID=158751 RepID=UPI00258CF76E|nr:heavy metal-associated domain-containing protein [uncultured Acidovorax sp.]